MKCYPVVSHNNTGEISPSTEVNIKAVDTNNYPCPGVLEIFYKLHSQQFSNGFILIFSSPWWNLDRSKACRTRRESDRNWQIEGEEKNFTAIGITPHCTFSRYLSVLTPTVQSKPSHDVYLQTFLTHNCSDIYICTFSLSASFHYCQI